MTKKTTNRSISLTNIGVKAVQFLQANSINVSNYIEKLLVASVLEDFKIDMRGEETHV